LAGRDWLQQLGLVNVDGCKNTHETFILFYFISHLGYFISARNKIKLITERSSYFLLCPAVGVQ